MDKTDNNLAANISSGLVPMARINGAAIRRLRESKGLTQLYMATVIGVTTDTISRWENRRYPSIKLDNAERLAQALEVELEAILEQELPDAAPAAEPAEAEAEGPPPFAPNPPPTQPHLAAPLPKSRPPFLFPVLLAFVFLLALGGIAWWLRQPAPPRMGVVAERILPDHIPLGQIFPVLIRVTMSQSAPVSLILKETIPPGCRLINAEPPLTSDADASGALKWIIRADKQVTTFSYLLKAPASGEDEARLQFSGGLTLKQGDSTQTQINGKASMVIAPYHWADIDRDNTIDDEEILAVYDRYSAMEQPAFDRDLIDSIWASTGYVWERKTGKYVIRK